MADEEGLPPDRSKDPASAQVCPMHTADHGNTHSEIKETDRWLGFFGKTREDLFTQHIDLKWSVHPIGVGNGTDDT